MFLILPKNSLAQKMHPFYAYTLFPSHRDCSFITYETLARYHFY